MQRIHAVLSILCLFAVVGGMTPPYVANAHSQPVVPQAVPAGGAAAAAAAAPIPGQTGVDAAVPAGAGLAAEGEALTAALNAQSAEQVVGQAVGQAATLPPPRLEPNSGYAGQSIEVSGEAPADAPGVRIAWMYGGTSRTAAVVDVSPLSRYSAEVTVPYDAGYDPGQELAKICVALTGSEAAEYSCTDFTVTPAPPGVVEFVPPTGLQFDPADPAYLQLLDRSGVVLSQLPLVSADTIYFTDVPAGIYDLAVVGSVSPPFAVDSVVVVPNASVSATSSLIADTEFDPLTGLQCDNSRRVARLSLTPSTKQATIPELADAGLAAFPAVAANAPTYDFGVYVAGVALQGSLEAQIQGGNSWERNPRYVFVSNSDPKKQVQAGELGGSNGVFKGPVNLGAGDFTPGLWTLYVYPRAGVIEYCPTTRVVRFVADPMKHSIFRQGGQSVTKWNSAAQQYEFNGIAPNVPILPLKYPEKDISIPLIGPLKNELEAGLFVQGTLGLNYTISFTAVNARAYALAINQSLFNKDWPIKPGWMNDVSYDPDNPRSLRIDVTEQTLVTKDWKVQVYRGVLASFWGVVTVNAAVNIGLHGELLFRATIYPLEPAVDVTLTPALEPWLAISIWVDLLLGLASAGADATAGVRVALPTHFNTSDKRYIYFESPCVALRAVLSVWARINLYFYEKTWNLGSWDLVKYKTDACGGYPDPEPPAPPRPPRLLGTPVMASGTDGRIAAAFIGDANQGNTPIQPKVYVGVKEPDQKEWKYVTFVPLTDGSHMVQDPALTFAHQFIIAAWTETNMSQAEEKAATTMEQILQRQEIRYSYALNYDPKRSWSTPGWITDDRVADGRPVLAGQLTDGATLAWVRSGGQSGYTRGSTDIAVVEYDHIANSTKVVWGQRKVIAADGMDAQPALARFKDFNNHSWGTRLLAFVANADGDTTGKTRRIRFFYSDPYTADLNWKELDTSQLPANPMSPAVGMGRNGYMWLAFLAGSQSAAAAVDTHAELYLARWSQGKFAGSRRVLDWKNDCNVGDPVYAEKPTLLLNDTISMRVAVVFRRFGDAGSNGALGQIAEMQLNDWAEGCRWQGPPVYLTDDRRPNWLPTAAYQLVKGDISVLWLQRATESGSAEFQAALAQLDSASTAALPAAAVETLPPASAIESTLATGAEQDPAQAAQQTGDDLLKVMTLENAADPSLDPALLIEPPLASAGSAVAITATVRNLGLADTGDIANSVTVELYQGTSPGGVKVQEQVVVEPLSFGVPWPVVFTVQAGNAPEPYYAVVVPGANGDIGAINNTGVGTLNALERPQILGIVESPRFVDSMELNWSDDGNPARDGYRIVRATSPDGPYELVGITQEPFFADLDLDRVVTYYYKVQSYDAAGVVSAYSLPVAASLPGEYMYMPIIFR